MKTIKFSSVPQTITGADVDHVDGICFTIRDATYTEPVRFYLFSRGQEVTVTYPEGDACVVVTSVNVETFRHGSKVTTVEERFTGPITIESAIPDFSMSA